ncbi:MAG: carboxypeptidase-like regulatory domain-containing protein, partial [Syntrophorhabdaceae bacterium]|nr:carboxypeptidase-like regulatory domain-containing protein [Syntrophorhabdaceae bacterium]
YLSKGEVLKDAFREAAHITQLYFKESEANCGNNNLCKQDKTRQHPLLDDNGDGKGSWMNIVGQEDGGVTSKLVLGLGTNPNVLSWQEVMPTTTTLGNTLTTWAKTSDPSKTVASWVEIKKPSFVATEASSGQVALNLPRTMGSYNKDSNRWEYNLTNLDEKGLYTLFYYAMDSGGDLIPPAIGTIYVDTQTNNPPLPFTTGSPTMNQDVNDAMMIFRWNPAYDPDGDKLTYTLRIYEDLNNSKGTEIKRYELIPQEAYPINAFKETRNDGITPLFTTGNYYWFDVEAIDGKGKSVFSNAVRFRITFTNALTGIITGIIYSDVDSSKITTANITASVGSVFLLSNGSYIISVPSGTSTINITTTATGFESASKSNISINPGEIKTLNIPMTSIKTDTLLSLSSGWNFISLPYQPTDTNIMSALSSILNNVRMVWGYDNRDKEWMVYKSNVQGSLFKVLNTIETGKGYWIYMNAPTIFDMSNWTSGSRSISLNKGWNLIGWNGDNGIAINDALNNLGSKWDIIWGWENGIWKAKHSNPEINLNVEPLNNLNRGRAYWIKMNTSTEWMQ